MCVVGGVEEVLTVEFAEDERQEDVAGGDSRLRVGFLDSLEAGEGSVVVEDVEVLVGVADLRGEVDGVGVGGGGVVGTGGRRSCQKESKHEDEDGCAAFYCFSPGQCACSGLN